MRSVINRLSKPLACATFLSSIYLVQNKFQHTNKAYCLWGKPFVGGEQARPTVDHLPNGSCSNINCISRLADVAENVSDTVVSIRTEIDVSIRSGLFRRETELVVSKGTGFFVSDDGLILTNAHVVEDIVEGGRLYVSTSDGKTYEAQLHSIDPWSDFAIIQVKNTDNKKWKSVIFSDVKSLRPGTPLFTFGDPLGLGHSLTYGVLSASSRRSSDLHMEGRMDGRLEFLQINFTGFDYGYSGGAVFDMNGQVVGINVIKSENTPGISFAVSVASVKKLIDEMMNKRKVERPWYGLRVVSLTPSVVNQLARVYDAQIEEDEIIETERTSVWYDLSWLWAGRQEEKKDLSNLEDENIVKGFHKLYQLDQLEDGVLVLSIFGDSPASRAMCKVGDVITHVNGEPVASTGEFFAEIGYESDNGVELRVKRMSKDGTSAETVKLFLKPEVLDVFDETKHPLNVGDGQEYEEYLNRLDQEKREKAEFLK